MDSVAKGRGIRVTPLFLGESMDHADLALLWEKGRRYTSRFGCLQRWSKLLLQRRSSEERKSIRNNRMWASATLRITAQIRAWGSCDRRLVLRAELLDSMPQFPSFHLHVLTLPSFYGVSRP